MACVPLLSSMNYVGWGLAIAIASIGFLFGERIPKKFVKRVRFNIFFVVLPSTLFELNSMTRISTKINGMIPKLNTSYGSISLTCMYAKVAWKRLAKYMKISMFWAKAFLEGVSQMWVARGVHCRRDNRKSLEIGNNIVCRYLNTLVGLLKVWGLSLVGGWDRVVYMDGVIVTPYMAILCI